MTLILNMSLVPNVLKGAGAFAILTGVMDAFIGTRALEVLAGEEFLADTLVTAVTDSQIRFFGSAWAGYGAMLWWASNDVHARSTPLAILGGAMILGGFGRSLSMLLHRIVSPAFVVFIVVEILGPPGIWLTLRGGKRETSSGAKRR